MTDFIAIEDITPGETYACKFRVTVMLDELGRPAPNLSDTPLKGEGEYEGLGVLTQRDLQSRLVRLHDDASKRDFVVSFDDIWDIDVVEWTDGES
jgi:hypothetical protein